LDGGTSAAARQKGSTQRQTGRLRPREKATLHAPILNNLLPAPKYIFKRRLRNREGA
jgi:hypothetical protein